MRTITMMEFRRGPGEFILDVVRDGQSFLLTKGGKPVARLVPVDDVTIVDRNGRVRGPSLLDLSRIRR